MMVERRVISRLIGWVLWAPVLTTVVLVLVEPGLKTWVTTPGANPPLIPGLRHLGFTLTAGMTWDLLADMMVPLALLQFIGGVGRMRAVRLQQRNSPWIWPHVWSAAGAFGPAFDGLSRGAVVDALTSLQDLVPPALPARPFPLFNWSDVLICIGPGGVALNSWQKHGWSLPRFYLFRPLLWHQAESSRFKECL